MNKIFSIIVIIITLMVCEEPLSLARSENSSQEIRVNVKINKSTGEITAIQLGDHGSFVPLNQITRDFDTNKDGKVTLNEFQNNTNKINNNWKITSHPVNMKLSNGMTAQDAERLLDYMDTAKQYLAYSSKTYTPPTTISLGNDGKGDYYNTNTNEMHFSSVNQDSAIQKTFQKYITDNYSNLNYTAIEAYSRYFANQLTGNSAGENNIYDQNLESLNGGNVYNKNTDPSLVANNNLALTQALSGIEPGTAWQSLQNLNNSPANIGSDYENAVLAADQQTTGGQNTNAITDDFNDHGF